MLATYRDVLWRALQLGTRGWLAAVAIPIYGLVIVAAALLAKGLGSFLGGIAMLIVGVACMASYLSLIADVVAGSKIRFADIKRVGPRFWDVWSVSFALFILGLGLSVLMSAAGPRARFVAAGAQLLAAVFLNVVPELLYLGRSRSFALLKESIDFIQVNAFSWLFPNILFATVLLAASGLFTPSEPAMLIYRLPGLLSPAGFLSALVAVPRWAVPLIILFIHFVMVFRGLLFQELASGNPRQRAFKRQLNG
jgi:hypothetical protein